MGFIYEWEKVSSSLVSRIGYTDDEGGAIAIHFTDGNKFYYPRTTEEQFLAFQKSRSKGKWVIANLADKTYKKLS